MLAAEAGHAAAVSVLMTCSPDTSVTVPDPRDINGNLGPNGKTRRQITVLELPTVVYNQNIKFLIRVRTQSQSDSAYPQHASHCSL